MASQQLIGGLTGTAKAGGFGSLIQGLFGKKLAKGDIATEATPAVFGEAGPEGVLPLRRGADGNLGVIATGGGGGNQDSQITIINTIAPAEMVKVGLGDPQVRNVIINEISGDILKRGTIFKTMRRS